MTDLRTPSQAELWSRLLDENGAVLRMAMPGKVESYNSATRTATVKPMTKVPLADGDGTRRAYELDAIHAVPVVWPGQVSLTAGDGVLLVFCDFDLGAWRDGAGKTPADPGDETAHGPSGAVAIPGLDTVARKSAEQSEFVALANLVLARLTTIQQAFDTHVHSGVTTGAGSSAIPVATIGPLASVASALVKVRT